MSRSLRCVRSWLRFMTGMIATAMDIASRASKPPAAMSTWDRIGIRRLLMGLARKAALSWGTSPPGLSQLRLFQPNCPKGRPEAGRRRPGRLPGPAGREHVAQKLRADRQEDEDQQEAGEQAGVAHRRSFPTRASLEESWGTPGTPETLRSSQ